MPEENKSAVLVDSDRVLQLVMKHLQSQGYTVHRAQFVFDIHVEPVPEVIAPSVHEALFGKSIFDTGKEKPKMVTPHAKVKTVSVKVTVDELPVKEA